MDGKTEFAEVTDNEGCCFHSVLSIHQNEGCVVDVVREEEREDVLPFPDQC